MQDSNDNLGTITKNDDYYSVTLKREIDHDIKTVWSFLTDPSKFVNWLAPGEIELVKGGSAKLNFADSGIVIDSKVSQYSEGTLLEYSWSNGDEPLRPICWQLEDTGNATALTLTLGIPEGDVVHRSCAGWEAHLMMLLAALEGVSIKFPFERFMESQKGYEKLLAG